MKSLNKFDAISLEQLNATMSFMDRIESKFVMNEKQLPEMLKKFEKDYYILQIKNKSVFGYHSVYFDTKDYKFYREHGKGLKMRTKIRSRCYVDSGLTYFEFKQRYYETVRKFRFEQKNSAHGKFNAKSKKFFDSLYRDTYGDKLNQKITPSIITEYKRFTLCSKNNDERLTIDTKLRFTNSRNKIAKYSLDDVAIIEVKSSKEDTKGRQILTKMWLSPIEACSKYCLAVHNLIPKVKKYERFEWAMNYISNVQTISE